MKQLPKQEQDILFKRITDKRHNGKQVNYSATYGATPQRLVWDSGLNKKTAKTLHEAYWKRNWALNAIAKACTVKNLNGQKWIYNPVSEFWYTLRHDKDRFSTLNQSTGVYCFDTWIKHILSIRKELTGQMHDEGIWTLLTGNRKKFEHLLQWAIKQTNKELNLNVQLGVQVTFGNNYSEIH